MLFKKSESEKPEVGVVGGVDVIVGERLVHVLVDAQSGIVIELLLCFVKEL